MLSARNQLYFYADQPVVILVEPQLGENIGMVARAMSNFSLSRLRLVNPRDGWPNERARVTASKGGSIIDNVCVFTSLEEAIADLNFVYATTARNRDSFKPVDSPEKAAFALKMRILSHQAVGLVFGRECSGLTNKELTLVDEIITFPVNSSSSSLNISQAVLLMAWEFMKINLKNVSEKNILKYNNKPATKDELFNLFMHLEHALEVRGYFYPVEKKEKMIDNLRAVLMRPGFTHEELTVLRGVISSLDRFSENFPRGDRRL
ncbi:tRNA:Cm32/Um32 methyltransferase [Liberibacter crescens BT-1]|uniref:tRNA:Cm32/Um32 methyltransferase n=1 Tax=Liberibacter crescens (strain BT-1) TaxID=1215343 RepID=L0EVX5_LIBCB|nr:RNA methyltransferase [Liberibacter crescens]AGA64516.1 tRNA:Cm32/Um32 methyltransferase [Liberibacter crescens BT-1]